MDGELTQLDARALAQHLEACPSCRSFATTVDSLTGAMRTAEPEAFRVQWSPVRRRRSVDGLMRRAVTLAGVAGIAAFAGAGLQTLDSPPSTPGAMRVLVIDTSGTDSTRETRSFLRGLKDAALTREVGAPDRDAANRPGSRAN